MAILDTMAGGLLALLGGFAASWSHQRTARSVRINEIIAERKVDANRYAYENIKVIESKFILSGPGEAREFMAQQESWFLGSRLFLPGRFPDKWLALRLKLDEILEMSGPANAAEGTPVRLLKRRVRELVRECILEIYADMNMKELDVPT